MIRPNGTLRAKQCPSPRDSASEKNLSFKTWEVGSGGWEEEGVEGGRGGEWKVVSGGW